MSYLQIKISKMRLYMSQVLLSNNKYQDSNALALCFEHVDIKWYHLPTTLESERTVNHLVLFAFISTQTRNQKQKSKLNQTVVLMDR